METGNITFILICTAMVFLMTPALAFFYGGLERRKNVINTMMMSIATIGLASLIWVIVGYTLSFSGTGDFIGDLKHLFLNDVSMTKGNGIPDGLFAGFQMMFSLITAAIITGSVVGRMRFSALMIFLALWLVVVYPPMAHMVWGGGFIAKLGAIDFAGGTVVHISSGLTGLILCIFVGKRREYKQIDYRPHNIPSVVLGAGLLWFGWFGFNAGSALAANHVAIQAFLTTNTAAAAAMLSWMAVEKIASGKPTLVGACTGALVGLVAITPAAGFVDIWASIVIGVLVSPFCFYSIHLIKQTFGLDDSLDAFGCHGMGGIFGSIITGVLADPAVNSAKGLVYGGTDLFVAQIEATLLTIVYVGVVSVILILLVKAIMPIRVTEKEESIGLDRSEHNESAYPTFMGLDS